MSTNGAPSAAQILLYTGARASVLEGAYLQLGMGAAGETNTLAALENSALAAILGDGSTTNPGLGHPQWQALVSDALKSAAAGARYDALFARQSLLMRVLDDLVQGDLPPGWRFASIRSFDGYLTRLNGAANAPTTPPAAGTLTAVQNGAGALPNTSSGSAPRVLHTLVGASDELESLPTAEAAQTAISGPNNGYTYQISGVAPAGIRKVRIYRSVFGASGAPYGWDQDVSVTPGAAYPAIAILQPDSLLRMDWNPPVWMQCGLRPAAAALYALAFAARQSTGSGLMFGANGMVSPGNVLLASASGFLGIGNPMQSGLFGQSRLTALNTSAFTAGGIQMLNSPAQNLQGFAGARSVRARCTSALNGTLTPTISITYCDAAHGWASAQTTGGLTASTGFSTGAVGDTARFTAVAGQIIQSVTETSVAGSATSGAWVYEAG